MKKTLVVILLSSVFLFVACSSTSSPSPTSTAKKITLADAPDILNLTDILPGSFEQIDAGSEGMSNKDMGLGSDASEVQLFLSEDPFQMIYCFLGISQSRIEQAGFDTMVKDEEQMKSLIIDNLQAGAIEEGIDMGVPEVELTYPNIGDSAVLGVGSLSMWDVHLGFDVSCFRSNTVYVYIYSIYWSEDNMPLTPIAETIQNRLNSYEH